MREHPLNVNIRDFLRQQQGHHLEATGALTNIIEDMARVAKGISHVVATAGIHPDILRATGETNVQGEFVQALDEKANWQFKDVFSRNPYVAGYASEEDENFTPFFNGENSNRRYVLWFDPLDGSSNFAKNVSIGSIFSIYPRVSDPRGPVNLGDFLQPGRNQVASGYFLYGPSTVMVYTAGDGVHNFTLDPTIGEFVLPRDYCRTTTPERGKVYSINEGYRPRWLPETTTFVDQLQREGYSSRYIGSMVPDVHRNLLDGGIFLYPADNKSHTAKLRLACESKPLAKVIEAAGGLATDGQTRILDIVPRELHQRHPVVMGSRREVELYQEIVARTR